MMLLISAFPVLLGLCFYRTQEQRYYDHETQQIATRQALGLVEGDPGCPAYYDPTHMRCHYGKVILYPASAAALGETVTVRLRGGAIDRTENVVLPSAFCAPTGAQNFSISVTCPDKPPRLVGWRWWRTPTVSLEVCK